MSSLSWTLGCSVTGSCGVITALFLSCHGYTAADGVLCISLNAIGGALLTAGSAGNAVESAEFWPFVVLNAVFCSVATLALVRCVVRSSAMPNEKATAVVACGKEDSDLSQSIKDGTDRA